MKLQKIIENEFAFSKMFCFTPVQDSKGYFCRNFVEKWEIFNNPNFYNSYKLSVLVLFASTDSAYCVENSDFIFLPIFQCYLNSNWLKPKHQSGREEVCLRESVKRVWNFHSLHSDLPFHRTMNKKGKSFFVEHLKFKIIFQLFKKDCPIIFYPFPSAFWQKV